MSSIPRVKICGITSPATAAFTAAAGADAMGIVFYENSPRHVGDIELAREIALAAGPFVTVVGLFVDASRGQVERVLKRVPLGMLQFHGHEDEAFCASLDRPYIKALRMKPGLDVARVAAGFDSACGLLLDAYTPGVPGGTGATFDWSSIPSGLARPLILAGGLNVDNIAHAVQRVKPWAVDVSGGVESAPGVKSCQLVSEFIRRAKQANFSDRGESS